MKKCISINDERVIKTLSESKNASRLIEEAILYYLDGLEEERISRETVKDIVIDCLKGGAFMPIQAPMTNPNYEASVESIKEDIDMILNL